MLIEHDGKRPASLDLFLEILELNEDEFNEIAMKHMVHPYLHDPDTTPKGDPLPDTGDWRDTLGVP